MISNIAHIHNELLKTSTKKNRMGRMCRKWIGNHTSAKQVDCTRINQVLYHIVECNAMLRTMVYTVSWAFEHMVWVTKEQ